MNRTRALIVSLAVGLAAVAGVFALSNTISLGAEANATTNQEVARRTAQLNRYEASLQKALAQEPPALPSAPASADAAPRTQSAAPVQVVYHRPPPVVAITPRTDDEDGTDEHEERAGQEHDGREDDD